METDLSCLTPILLGCILFMLLDLHVMLANVKKNNDAWWRWYAGTITKQGH